MTDFLAKLVAKSTGSAGGIRPHLPSRFEPTGFESITEIAEEPRPNRTAPAAGEVLAPEVPVTPPAQPNHLPTPQDPSRPQSSVPPVEPQREPLRSLVADPARSSPSPAIGLIPAVETSLGDLEPGVSADAPNASSVPMNTLLIVERESAAAALPQAGEPDSLTTRFLSVDPPTAVSQPGRGAPARQAAANRAARRSTIARAPAAPTAITQPEIHVTIGRVEVRAVASPAPAPRPQTRPQHMSLDEYLRQRSTAGRG